MRDRSRIFAILAALRTLWFCLEDMRFFQFLTYISSKICEYEGIEENQDLFYLEDDKIEGYLYRMIAEVKDGYTTANLLTEVPPTV